MATSPTREALCDWLVFEDEHDGTAHPTSRADLLDNAWTNTGLIAFILDIKKAMVFFEVTAVRRNHPTIDGPLGHNGGLALDGWPLQTRTHADWMDADNPHFQDMLAFAAASPWCFQIGLVGDGADSAANLKAAGPTAFQDEGGPHVHFGAHAG